MKKYFIVLCSVCIGLALTACKDSKSQQSTANNAKMRTEYIHVGQNWDAVYRTNSPENKVKVAVTSKEKIKVGDQMSFSVTSDKDGKLWVIQVDPDDKVTTLLPNSVEKGNDIKAKHPFRFPPAGANWSVQASKPAGKSIIAFIVTTGGSGLADAIAAKDMAKSLAIVEQAPAWGIAKVVVDVTE